MSPGVASYESILGGIKSCDRTFGELQESEFFSDELQDFLGFRPQRGMCRFSAVSEEYKSYSMLSR